MKCWKGYVWIAAIACQAQKPEKPDPNQKLEVVFREVPLSEIGSDPDLFALQRKYPLDVLLANFGVSNSQFWVAQNHVWYETRQPLSQIGIDFDTSYLINQKKICLFRNNCLPIYFGTLHSHTQDSDGEGTITDAVAIARDVAKLDFFAVTDHSEYLNFETSWQKQKSIAATFRTTQFLPVVGFEYSHPLLGHFVLLGSKTWTSAWRDPSLGSFYHWLAGESGSIGVFAHPGYHRIRKSTDFARFKMPDPMISNMVGIETIHRGVSSNFMSGFTGAQSYLDDAVSQGWHVSPMASQDNHSLNWGIQDASRVALPLPQLNEGHLLQAMKARRFYATQIEGQLLDVHVHLDNRVYVAGDVVSLKKQDTGAQVEFVIRYLDPNSFEPLFGFEILHNGKVVGSHSAPIRLEKKRLDKLQVNKPRWQKIQEHMHDAFFDIFMNGLGFLGGHKLPDIHARESQVSIGEFKFKMPFADLTKHFVNGHQNRSWIYMRLWQGARGKLLTQSAPVTFVYDDETSK